MTAPISPQMRESLFTLRYPRSLGTFSTYDEVQSVVDALADHDFPVQNTMIVGTDLKQVERVTGRRTWGGVIRDGIVSGIWMGLFVGILFWMTSQNAGSVLIAVVMGIVFFTVWSVIRYAMTNGKRDFTSLTATIPLQYELLVEHSDADAARRVLADAGVRLPADPSAAPRTGAYGGPTYGQAGPTYGQAGPTYGQAGSARGRFGQAGGAVPQGPHGQAGDHDAEGHGSHAAPSGRPTYGRPASAPSAGSAPDAQTQASPRPTFGQPGPVAQEQGPAAQPGSAAKRPGTTAQPDAAAQQDGPAPHPDAESEQNGGRREYGYGQPDSDGRPGTEEPNGKDDAPRR